MVREWVWTPQANDSQPGIPARCPFKWGCRAESLELPAAPWSPLGEGLPEDRLSLREAPGTALEHAAPQLLRLPLHVWMS